MIWEVVLSIPYQCVLARLQYVWWSSIGGEEERIEEAVGRYLCSS